MAYLQFLSGSRDQEFQELNPSASLNLGSAEGIHIRVTGPEIEPQHCTVFPGDGKYWLQQHAGKTIINMRGVAPQSTVELADRQVFIVGQTFVKFWEEKPEGGGGGGGGGGADPAELEQAKQKLSAAEAELEQLRSSSGSAGEELAKVKGELEQAQSQVSELTQAKTEAEEKAAKLEGEIEGVKSEAEQAQAAAKEEAEQAKQEAEQAAADAKAEAEKAAAEAKEEAERSTQEMRDSLQATREALEGLKARADALGKDRLAALAEPSDLQASLEALKLPEAARLRLEQAVASEVDREVLRRMSGPVIPLRGLRAPGSDDDLEGELRAARQREQRIGLAKELGLHELEAGELDRLLEMAKS